METKVIREGNAFYEIDEDCRRRKQEKEEQTKREWENDETSDHASDE